MQPQQSQPSVSMSPILQALARRQMGPLGGGSGTPMAQQTSMPTHQLPTGGPAAPTQGAPQLPNASLSNMPVQVDQGAQNGALKSGQQAQGPMFDPETRDLAKSLVQRLLKGL